MPEEALSEREHLRTGASANGVTHDDTPAGTRDTLSHQGCARLAVIPSLTRNPEATLPCSQALHRVKSTFAQPSVTLGTAG